MAPTRPESTFSPLPELAKGFQLSGISRNYNHQYANMYFSRLSELSRSVKKQAHDRWATHKSQFIGSISERLRTRRTRSRRVAESYRPSEGRSSS